MIRGGFAGALAAVRRPPRPASARGAQRAFRALRYHDGRLVAGSAVKYAEFTYGSRLAHWRFDEGQGATALDAAGDADGALEGPPSWTQGKVRGAHCAGGIDYGAGPGELHIGGDLHGYPGFFRGLIDAPAVLGRALK